MQIGIASDHAGFELKASIRHLLEERGHAVSDAGPDTFEPADDYPPFIAAAARRVSRGEDERAIVIGGSGYGEAIVANRFARVRAVAYYGGPLDIIRLSREHNDANVLSLGARFLTHEEATAAVLLWLETPFSGEERHVRRIAEIEEAART